MGLTMGDFDSKEAYKRAKFKAGKFLRGHAREFHDDVVQHAVTFAFTHWKAYDESKGITQATYLWKLVTWGVSDYWYRTGTNVVCEPKRKHGKMINVGDKVDTAYVPSLDHVEIELIRRKVKGQDLEIVEKVLADEFTGKMFDGITQAANNLRWKKCVERLAKRFG